jgi:hypothetical protein
VSNEGDDIDKQHQTQERGEDVIQNWNAQI